MIPFRDRYDAGQQLAKALERYKNDSHVVVLGLPRGGVILAYEISQALHSPLDLIIIRKLGAPYQSELAIGATDEKGHVVLNQDIIGELQISSDYIKETSQRAQSEAQQLYDLLRGKTPPLELKEKIAIIVDDGLATGATMEAAVMSAKAKQAKKIIVAVPVGSRTAVSRIEKKIDNLICLHSPSYFRAVGLFYKNFEQTSDNEVKELMNRYHKEAA